MVASIYVLIGLGLLDMAMACTQTAPNGYTCLDQEWTVGGASLGLVFSIILMLIYVRLHSHRWVNLLGVINPDDSDSKLRVLPIRAPPRLDLLSPDPSDPEIHTKDEKAMGHDYKNITAPEIYLSTFDDMELHWVALIVWMKWRSSFDVLRIIGEVLVALKIAQEYGFIIDIGVDMPWWCALLPFFFMDFLVIAVQYYEKSYPLYFSESYVLKVYTLLGGFPLGTMFKILVAIKFDGNVDLSDTWFLAPLTASVVIGLSYLLYCAFFKVKFSPEVYPEDLEHELYGGSDVHTVRTNSPVDKRRVDQLNDRLRAMEIPVGIFLAAILAYIAFTFTNFIRIAWPEESSRSMGENDYNYDSEGWRMSPTGNWAQASICWWILLGGMFVLSWSDLLITALPKIVYQRDPFEAIRKCFVTLTVTGTTAFLILVLYHIDNEWNDFEKPPFEWFTVLPLLISESICILSLIATFFYTMCNCPDIVFDRGELVRGIQDEYRAEGASPFRQQQRQYSYSPKHSPRSKTIPKRSANDYPERPHFDRKSFKMRSTMNQQGHNARDENGLNNRRDGPVRLYPTGVTERQSSERYGDQRHHVNGNFPDLEVKEEDRRGQSPIRDNQPHDYERFDRESERQRSYRKSSDTRNGQQSGWSDPHATSHPFYRGEAANAPHPRPTHLHERLSSMREQTKHEHGTALREDGYGNSVKPQLELSELGQDVANIARHERPSSGIKQRQNFMSRLPNNRKHSYMANESTHMDNGRLQPRVSATSEIGHLNTPMPTSPDYPQKYSPDYPYINRESPNAMPLPGIPERNSSPPQQQQQQFVQPNHSHFQEPRYPHDNHLPQQGYPSNQGSFRRPKHFDSRETHSPDHLVPPPANSHQSNIGNQNGSQYPSYNYQPFQDQQTSQSHHAQQPHDYNNQYSGDHGRSHGYPQMETRFGNSRGFNSHSQPPPQQGQHHNYNQMQSQATYNPAFEPPRSDGNGMHNPNHGPPSQQGQFGYHAPQSSHPQQQPAMHAQPPPAPPGQAPSHFGHQQPPQFRRSTRAQKSVKRPWGNAIDFQPPPPDYD